MADTLGSEPSSSSHLVFPVAASVCFLASGLTAATMIAINHGFGAGDMWSFLVWSLPFAALIGVSNLFLTRLYCRLLLPIRYPVAILLGAIAGALWTYLVALFLGAWFGAFSFPVLSCWIGGGAGAMVIAAGTCMGVKKKTAVVELLLVTAIIVIAAMGTEPLFAWLSPDQRLEVVFVQWTPSSEHLSVKGIPSMAESPATTLTSKEVAQLEAMGLTGKLTITASSFQGTGKQSRAVIVMHRQVESAVELAQPDATEVIYVQNGNEWKMYPPDAPTLKRAILLEPFKHDPRSTSYMVELADGAAQGGTAFRW